MEQQKYHERGGLLGKLSPGEKKLDGKTFYLDRVKKRSTALLLEAITQFGGKIESFLHKDVKFVVTGSLEELSGHGASDSKAKSKTTSEEATPSKQQESVLRNDSQRQGTPRPVACGSRGKALLEKAIRNNERLQGSSVLTNARSWGVKILYADDVLLYLKQLSRESFDSKSKKSEKVYIKQSSNVVKATALRSPYLKIEDSSRKYKPLHMQSMTFPSLYYSGQYSPFECPPPPRFEKWTETTEKKNRENHKVVVSTEDKCQTPLSCNPSPWRPRKKDVAYCECCHQTYNNQEEHLQSDQHRAFVLDASNYSVVDQLVAAMVPDFNPDPPPQPKEPHDRQTSTIQDVCELEPLTDMEMEDAVKELQTQLHLDTDVSSLTKGTVLPALAINKLEIQQPTPNPVEVEIPALTPETDSKPLSPVMPMLEIVPQEQPLTDPHQDIKPLSPCPVNRFTNPDPFPPVLSPQVADLHAHSSDLEAPILSPQPLTSEEPKGEHVVEIDNQSSVFQPIPVDTLLSTTPVYTAVELCEKTESEIKVAICYNSWKRRSRSLPKQSTTTLNSKKRCRSASPECSLSKRRRTNAICGYKKTKQGPQSGNTKDKYSLFFESASSKFVQSSPKPVRTLTKYCTIENSPQIFSTFSAPQMNMAAQWPPSSKPSCKNSPPGDKSQSVFSSQDSQPSNSHSTSVCIESALIPDIAALSSLSSDSDWDCELLSRLGPPSGTALAPVEPNCELDQEFLHQPCTWMHDSSYESRLHNVLQPTTQAVSVDSSSFSRAVVQIVEVQH